MDESDYRDNYNGSRIDMVHGSPKSHYPQPLDPVITMAAVQQYVESERSRSRRSVVLVSTIFLFIVLFILALFVLIGGLVLRSSKDNEAVIADVVKKTDLYSGMVSQVTGTLVRVENSNAGLQRKLEKSEHQIESDKKTLYSDLQRFSRWSASKEELRSLNARVEKLDALLRAKDAEIADLRSISAEARSMKPVVSEAPAVSAALPVEDSAADVSALPDNVPAVVSDAADDGDSSETFTAEPDSDTRERVNQVLTYLNGDRYVGEVAAGLAHGWGIYYYNNGDRYEGDFVDDSRHGRGKMIYSHGDEYEGEFKNDVRSGRGRLRKADNSRYSGQFLNDMMHGKGTYWYASGSKYVGDFKRNKKDGKGRFTFKNGDSYDGEFRNDLRNGVGTYEFGDGAIYIGDFVNGKRQGKGRYIYPSGEEYVGSFEDGKKHGEGLCIYANKTQRRGIWSSDRFVRWVN